uniref:Ig-like domain-containing protein n=1 Tax=Gouania willdenowi TaxID=441366 RepID=A0A8C5GPJ1_GOUWI
MELWLWILLAAFCFGNIQTVHLTGLSFWMFCSSTECKGEEKVTQPPGDVILTQGQTATLKCTFTTTYSDPALFWYKQEVNSYPKFILRRSRYVADNSPEFVKDRFDAELKDSSVPLMIQDLHVCDSAVYYCALRPTVTGNHQRLDKKLWSICMYVCMYVYSMYEQ